jgi:hypothetical protein
VCDPDRVRAPNAQELIDHYAAGLAAALRGPRRLREDMIAEARDSLLDATEAYVAAGVDSGEAAHRAVRDFGEYRQVVPAYQAELAVEQGRRTALLLAGALPVLHLAAPLMWLGSSHDSTPPVSGYWTLTDHFDYLSLLASGTAMIVLLGFGWGSRYVRDGVRYARAVGIGALAFLFVHAAVGAAIAGFSVYQWPASLTWPPLLIGIILMSGGFVYAVATAWRCVLASRPAIDRVST